MTEDHPQTISPLRQRMIDDMTIRKMAPKTQAAYIRAVKNFTDFLGRSPDTASPEDLRRFQLHLAQTGTSAPTQNATVTALRFFFEVTLGRRGATDHLPFVRQPRKLPVVLSPAEVARLLDGAANLKYKAALSIAYGAGLRAAELVSLKVSDIDSTRMVIRVEQGKGRKDRYAMLSDHLLHLLRAYWAASRPQGWLFPGRDPVNPSRCIPSGTASPPIFWSRKSMCASSSCSWGTRSLRPPRSMPRSPPARCARSRARSTI
jgi:site-specific recombinase XerD